MSDSADPTSVQITVRILLRAAVAEEPIRIAGLQVVVVGPARASDWAGVAVRQGDLEGIHWTSREELDSAISRLRSAPGVIAVTA